MPSFSQMTQVNSTDPLGGGLGARKPRPDEIAKQQAESAAKEVAERRTFEFEKIVHATEKQMRGEAIERASGSAPSRLDERGYLVQAAVAEKVWPDDFKREIADPDCDLLGVFNDHFGVCAKTETISTLARFCKMGPREYLAGMHHLETIGNRVWFGCPPGRKAFLRKAAAKVS